MKKKIIAAGHICINITPVFPAGTAYDRIGDILVPGRLIHMDPADVHTGGSVANTGLAFMYDCSTDSYEDNVEKVAQMVNICHAMGVTVEGELGHVGDNEGSAEGNDPTSFYTDVSLARDFVERTGVDALAVAVGNAHGDYKFPPKLDFQRIQDIHQRTNTPLVLHGGSGLSDDDFRTATGLGICKVNIFTDIDKAGKAGAKTMMGLIPYEIAAMKKVVENKIRLFGSVNRA